MQKNPLKFLSSQAMELLNVEENLASVLKNFLSFPFNKAWESKELQKKGPNSLEEYYNVI